MTVVILDRMQGWGWGVPTGLWKLRARAIREVLETGFLQYFL